MVREGREGGYRCDESFNILQPFISVSPSCVAGLADEIHRTLLHLFRLLVVSLLVMYICLLCEWL